MFTFILAVRLYSQGPIVAYPVKDCEEGVAWLHEAENWSQRSGLYHIRGQMYVCGRAETFQYLLCEGRATC